MEARVSVALEAQVETLRKRQRELQVELYHRDGTVFPVEHGICNERLAEIDELLTDAVTCRPDNLKPEDLLNLHLTDKGIFDLCREPAVLQMAQAILGTQDISIFTSRILCKQAGTGYAIPWHQDSNYWPLIPPGKDEVHPTVASLWLAIDDVRADNGKMGTCGGASISGQTLK
jgi:hypothetical protein